MTFVSNHIKYLAIQFSQILLRQGKLNRVACFPFVNPFLLRYVCFRPF